MNYINRVGLVWLSFVLVSSIQFSSFLSKLGECLLHCIMASSSKEINEPYKYYEYASGRGVPVEDVTSFMNWLCDMKERNQFAPTAVITAGSCVNSRIKLEYNKNFMDHMLVKDIIKKLQKVSCPKQAAILSKEYIDNLVINFPETLNSKTRKIIALVAIQGALRICGSCNV